MRQEEKLVVFLEYPMVIWNTVVFCEKAGLEYLDIRSSHT
jgi:hypothetical protein